MYTLGIITSSDKGYAGEREDGSGKVIKEIAEANGFKVESYVIVPDEKEMLKEQFIKMSDELGVNLILSTGGTGFAPRDVTPEATKEIIDREAPGIAEAIRMYSLSITKRAMLSRAVSGIRKKTLIVNLPGSPKACKEEINYVIVGASSFLKEPLEEMKEAYEKINNGAKVKLIFNQSSKLEEEIVRGVKMDIFIAYKEKYTDYIVDVGIAEESDVKSFGDTQVFYKKDLTESQNLESDIKDEEKFKYTVIRLSNNFLANKFMAFVESKEGEAILKKYSLIRKK